MKCIQVRLIYDIQAKFNSLLIQGSETSVLYVVHFFNKYAVIWDLARNQMKLVSFSFL